MSRDGGEKRHERLQRLLPRYLNGTLSEAERAELEALLTSESEVAEAFEEAKSEYVAAQDLRRPATTPEDRPVGGKKRVDGEKVAPRYSGPSRALARLRRLPPAIPWIIAAFAVLLLAFQTMRLVPSPQQTVAISGAEELGMRPFVLVSFADNAMMSDISETMQELGMTIVAGPIPGGLYRVTVPAHSDEEYDQMTARLQAEPVVEWLIAGNRPARR